MHVAKHSGFADSTVHEVLHSGSMTCSRCMRGERITGQRWCRACLTAYARERRARLQLQKRAPELLAKWHEAMGQIEQLLRGIGAMSQLPNCCRQIHFTMVNQGSCGCPCNKALQWLERKRVRCFILTQPN